jgi:uroporphyrinogen-III synthase
MAENQMLPSLQGCRIALTIDADDPFSPASELAEREAAIFYYPVAQTLPPNGYDELDALLLRCQQGEITWLLLPTPCAVEAVAERMAQLEMTADALTETKLALYGAKTHIVAHSIFPNWHSPLLPASTHEELVALMKLQPGDTVVIPLALHSRANWNDLVYATGASALSAPAYRLILGRGGDDLPGLLWGGLIDAIVFFTENSVRHFAIRLKVEGGSLDMLGDVVVACFDPQTAAAAKAYDLNVQILPSEGTFAALAESLTDFFTTEAVQA